VAGKLALSHAPRAGACAADGEIGDMGDTDSITDVFVAPDGRPAVNAQFNVTAGVGFSGGTTVEDGYRLDRLRPVVQVASSGGRDLITC
jgi:hypothetical protein